MKDIRAFVSEMDEGIEKKNIYSLLIADDESWVREEISNLIEWERYGISLLPAASDGEEALKRVSDESPDILITDVNMPFMTGVELLKRVKKIRPETVVVMLSGYDDYEYVRESLLAGAMDYLMKPISKMDLISVMTRALDVINDEFVSKNDRRVERRLLLSASGSLNDREYSEMIVREPSRSGFVRPVMQTKAKIPKSGFCAIMLHIDSVDTLLSLFESNPSLLSYAIKHRIEQEISQPPLLIFNNIYNTEEYILYVGGSAQESAELSRRLRTSIAEFTDREVTVGVSPLYFSEQDFSTAVVEARHACKKNETAEGSGRENVHKIIAYLNVHYTEELSLSYLAEQYNIESTYLSRLFKKETGETLISYIIKKRIEHAAELLSETAYSINEVASMVGYDDYNYFNRVFKKTVGISPGEYKKRSSK